MVLASWADRRRLGGRRPEAALHGWAADISVAVAIAAIDLVGAWDEAHSPVQGHPSIKLPPVPGWAYLFVALAGLALVGRRKWPLASFSALAGLTFGYTLLGYNDGAPFLAVAVGLYSLATVLNPKPVWLALAVCVAAYETALILFSPFGMTGGPITVVPWELAAGAGIGFFVASRRAQAARLRERADEQARQLVVEERLRIARELHDVVAHSMATINVQAGVALHFLREGAGSGPPEAHGPISALDAGASPTSLLRAVEAMEAVRATSKEALRELRGVLNLLRSSSEEEDKAPAPRLSQLGDLVEMTSKAGLPVEVRVLGERRDLPAAVDLAAYRIVQEALTNSLRHAGPARAAVKLEYRPDRLVVEVADDGQRSGAGTAASAGPRSGQASANGAVPGAWRTESGGKGLQGMRERAEALGGTFEAGPRSSGGFGVRAELPLPAAEQPGCEFIPERAVWAGAP
jgi:signal transduction histidine kinase